MVKTFCSPFFQNEVEVTDHKVLCCLCCASNPIIATVKLPRTGYVPGEMINFDAEIENRSNTVMKRSVVKLIMVSHLRHNNQGMNFMFLSFIKV